MAPSNIQLINQLKVVVWYHLDNDLLNNALFLAGRMHALDPRNTEAVHLLALCHQKSGQFKTAYHYTQTVARRGLHLGCAYVFAQACLKLQRAAEGIDALEKLRPTWESKIDWVKPAEPTARFLPDAAAVLNLLGDLYQANRRPDRAVECFAASLKQNPFMWDAFEKLSNSGTPIRPANIFKLSPELVSLISSQPEPTAIQPQESTHGVTGKPLQAFAANNNRFAAPPESDPFVMDTDANDRAMAQSGAAAFGFKPITGKLQGDAGHSSAIVNGLETPPATTEPGLGPRKLHEPTRVNLHQDPPNAPIRKPRAAQASNIEISTDAAKPQSLSSRNRIKPASDEAEPTETSNVATTNLHKRTISGSVSNSSDPSIRRSRRLFNQIRPNSSKPPPVPSVSQDKDGLEPKKVKATGTKGRYAAASTVGRVVSGNRKTVPHELRDAASRENRAQMPAVEPRGVPDKESRRVASSLQNVEATHWWLELLEKLGQGYYGLSQYDCESALKSFNDVPPAQRNTPWVLAKIGKAHYEQSEYLEAKSAFFMIRQILPSSVSDMETYSTVLWQLKEDTDLAVLAHDMIEIDRMSPEAWCTIGNAFSLQREHVQALKCFRRATQLNPKFVYAYTLQGHEYIANEEYDKAKQVYRRATFEDNRHYNGWYGLGKVTEKEGEYDQAATYYNAAISINPRNAVLRSCMGVMLEKQKHPEMALAQYTLASQLRPINTHALYRKARVLLHMRRLHEALSVLNRLKDISPDDSNVHFMLGQAHGRMRNKGLAIKHYTIAMNLDPKAAPTIKERMERLDEEDDEDEDEDEEMT